VLDVGDPSVTMAVAAEGCTVPVFAHELDRLTRDSGASMPLLLPLLAALGWRLCCWGDVRPCDDRLPLGEGDVPTENEYCGPLLPSDEYPPLPLYCDSWPSLVSETMIDGDTSAASTWSVVVGGGSYRKANSDGSSVGALTPSKTGKNYF